MNEPKLIHCVIGSIVSLLGWLLTAITWAQQNLNLIVAVFAIIASIWTMQAAKETVKLRREQRKRLKELDDI